MAEFLDDLDNDTICGVCNAEFLDIDDLKLHITQYHLTKTNQNRFCKICSTIFADIDSYALHIRDVHLNTLKSCKYCVRVYLDQDALIEHEKRHKSVKYFPKLSCSQCDTIFQSKEDLQNHEYVNHKDNEDGFMLQHCFAALSSFINMNIYKYFEATQHHLLFVCTACGRSTPETSTYIYHLKTKNCRSLTCEECCDVFAKKSKLRKHCKNHIWRKENKSSSKTQKQCVKCSKYYSFTEIKSHLKACNTIKCRKCPLTFSSVSELTQHITVHSQNISVSFITCKYCRKPFIGMTALRKHIERTHQHNIHLYKYNCIYCNIIFKHPKLLFGHFYTRHKDIQPYTCKICNEKFRIRKRFTLHIKLNHKSVGFVEFDDNFHVYFTDKKSDRNEGTLNKNVNLEKKIETTDVETLGNEAMPNDSSSKLIEKDEQHKQIMLDDEIIDDATECSLERTDKNPLYLEDKDKIEEKKNETVSKDSIQTKIECRKTNEKEIEIINLVGTQDHADNTLLVEVKKRKNKSAESKPPKKKSKLENDSSSDDSDVPLAQILGKKDKRVYNKVPRKNYRKTFMCIKCNRNCYTYQNYHRHMSLHKKNQRKTCIKCFKNFKTKEDLNIHMKSEHSSSKLTETLKKIMDERKKAHPESYASEKFAKTMTKVPIVMTASQAAITRVENKLSVKKFLENFSPEINENKANITNNLTIKPVSTVRTKPFIKLTKFTPEQSVTDRPKLKMPTKFTEESTEEYNVSIKLVHSDLTPTSLNLNNEISTADLNYNNFDDQSKVDAIPEVGHEIMLEETEVKNVKYLKKTIVIKDLLKYNNVRIGHLAPQAPFYKIVKIDDILEEKKVENKPGNVLLPNGTKLVNVNPLAHLLDRRSIKEICRSSLNTKSNTKLQDFSEAIVKAMTVLEKPMKKKKKNVPENTLES
ncbi:unnamed protein product, partial [Brenthis ino]